MILPRRLVFYVFGGIILLIAILWVNAIVSRHLSRNDAEAERNWNASVEFAKRTRVRIKETLARDSAATRVIEAARSVARAAVLEADRLRRERARIAPPSASDSTNPRWARLYGLAVVEIDSLRSAHRADSVALGAALWARDSLRAVLLTADTSLVELPKTGKVLIDARTCKVLWLIDCPSRRAVAIGAVVLGAAGGVLVERERAKRRERGGG